MVRRKQDEVLPEQLSHCLRRYDTESSGSRAPRSYANADKKLFWDKLSIKCSTPRLVDARGQVNLDTPIRWMPGSKLIILEGFRMKKCWRAKNVAPNQSGCPHLVDARGHRPTASLSTAPPQAGRRVSQDQQEEAVCVGWIKVKQAYFENRNFVLDIFISLA